MSESAPITAIITWSAQEGPAVPSSHRYRGSINLPGGQVWEDKPIARPGVELWHPDQLVHPLRIGARVHGDLIGDHCQWDYVERPVIGTCEDVPSGGTTPVDPGGVTPIGGRPPRPIGEVPAPNTMQLRGGSPLIRIALTHSTAELAEFLDILEAARRARA